MICRVVSWIRLSGRVPLRPAPFRFLCSTHFALDNLPCPNLLQSALLIAVPAMLPQLHVPMHTCACGNPKNTTRESVDLGTHNEVTRCAPLTRVQPTPLHVPEHGLLPCQLASPGGLPNAACTFCSAEPEHTHRFVAINVRHRGQDACMASSAQDHRLVQSYVEAFWVNTNDP